MRSLVRATLMMALAYAVGCGDDGGGAGGGSTGETAAQQACRELKEKCPDLAAELKVDECADGGEVALCAVECVIASNCGEDDGYVDCVAKCADDETSTTGTTGSTGSGTAACEERWACIEALDTSECRCSLDQPDVDGFFSVSSCASVDAERCCLRTDDTCSCNGGADCDGFLVESCSFAVVSEDNFSLCE